MSSTTMNEDLRSIKTERSLYLAMFSLLKTSSFKKITVKGICEEAFISRAAFYAHFIDKYDLLKFCLTEVWSKNIESGEYAKIESSLNRYIRENTRVLKNLLCEADNETFIILFDFILSVQNLTVEKKKGADTENHNKNVVLANFYAGGILSYTLWQIKNKFPADVPFMNKHLYDMINEFKECKLK